MSTSATPSSFSSGVSTASAAASCSITVSTTFTPARLTHATMFCVDDTAPVTTCTLTSSRAPVMPIGAPMPSCSSTTKSCGSTCRISRPVGSATALAASIARRTSSRVISRFLPATAITPRLLKPLTCGPDSARWTESISMPAISSASSIAFLIESTAASRLTTTPRLMPRDSATPMPTTSRLLSSMPSPTTQTTVDVPTSSPTMYRSLRATLSPSAGGTDVHAFIEPEVDVVDLRHALAQRGHEVDVRLHPLGEVLVADVHERGVVLEHDDGVVDVADVDLREPRRQIGTPLQVAEQAGGERRARIVDERGAGTPRRETVDDRQIELGVVGAELVDDRALAGRSDRARRGCGRSPSAARSEISTASVPGSSRRSAASATHGDASSFWRHCSRSAVTMLAPRRPSSSASTSPRDSRSLPRTVIRVTVRASADNASSTARYMPKPTTAQTATRRASVHHDGRATTGGPSG